MLILVFAETKNEEGNNIRTGMFDTGAVWMSLALQANRMGLNSRANGGIDLEATSKLLEFQKTGSLQYVPSPLVIGGLMKTFIREW